MSRRWLIIHALRALLIVATIQAAGPEGAQAQFLYDPFLPPVGPSPAYYVGYVASQGIPLSEDGQPIVVEYDAQGQVVGTVDVQPGMLIKSTQEWNSWVSRWEQARTEYEDAGGSTLELTRVEYDAAGRKCLDAEANEVSVSAATALLPEIRSVLVVRADAGLPACEGYILATSPLSEPRLPLAANASVVVDGEWRSQQVSETGHYFALETGYFDADASGCPEQSGLPPTVRNVQAFINCPAGSVQGVYAPVHGAEIETTSQNSFITVVTSPTGYYQLPYMSYGNVDDWSGDWVSARLAFARPDPRLRTARFFSLRKRGAGRTVSFAVDTVYLQAHARLMNDPSSIVDLVDPDYQFEDFTQYAVDPGGARGQDQGLLVEISAQDLRETDIYLFRVADNKLIGERRGMSPNELSGIPPDLAQFPNATVYPGCLGGACLSFVLVTRGPALSGAGGVSENNAFLPFASRPADGQPGLEPEYPDSPIRTFLRPGDAVKLVAINRSTGYTGVALGKVHVGEGGLSVIASPDDASAELVIDMFPPNLRVRANRQYEVEYGATAGEERNYIVGFEGSALNTDQLITIRTEWFAPDGSALPEGLPGLTGRLARVQMGELQAGGPTDAAGQALGQFSIEPGVTTSVVRLPEEGVEREHYYIHVDGAPLTGSVDFAGRAGISRPDFSVGEVCYYSSGDAQACFESQADHPELQSRPAQFVPFRVPVYDKDYSEAQRAAFLEQDLEDPGPVYRWPYRPEMQFTVHELQVEDVYRVEEDGTRVSVIADDAPFLTASSSGIDYTLFAPLDDPLSPLSPTVDDIDGDGQPEYRAFAWSFGTAASDPTLSDAERHELLTSAFLTDSESIQAEDFIALSLYQLGDEPNVLWEFAAIVLDVSPTVTGDPREDPLSEVFQVSVDDPELEFIAALLGYDKIDNAGPVTVRWRVEPSSFGVWTEPIEQTDAETGVFTNTLQIVETNPGEEAAVIVELVSEDGVEGRYETLVVVPGEPASIDVQTNGVVSAMEAGGIDVEVTVRDQFGNPVADGTSVDLSLKDSGSGDGSADAVLTLDGAPDGDHTAYEPGTVSGVVRAKIEGAAFESIDEVLVVEAGTLPPQEFPFEVKGLTVELLNPPASVFTGALQTIEARITDGNGDPVAGVEVTFDGTHAVFSEDEVKTNDQGVARSKFATGLQPRQGAELTVTLGIGQAGKTTHTYDVVPTLANEGLDVQDAMMVGDASVDGEVVYGRYDDVDVAIDYETTSEIQVSGDSGETLTVTLGNLGDPNLEPLLALHMNELVPAGPLLEAPDAVGLHPGEASAVTSAPGTPLGVGRSYLFHKRSIDTTTLIETPGSIVTVTNDPALALVDDVGFRFDFRPYEEEGTLLEYAGAHRVTYNESGVTYEVRTTDGFFSVTHALPIGIAGWYTVAARVRGGLVELEVNGVAALPTVITGSIEYDSGGDLVLGVEQYAGQMNSFKWYDWTAPALVEFDGGGVEQAVTLDASGTATLTLRSTGQMNSRQVGASLPTLRVPVHCGTAMQYAGLISTDAYADFAGLMLDAGLLAGAPPINPSSVDARSAPQNKSFAVRAGLVSVAHAQSIFETLAEKAWSYVKTAFGFIVPYEEAIMFVKQVSYFVKGSDQFDATELVIATLGVVTVVPIAKPLKFVLKPLRKLMKGSGGSAFVRTLSDVFGRAANSIKQGRLNKLRPLLPFLLIVGEMAIDPQARQGLTTLVGSIDSTDDLWAWVDYLGLPADGWDGDGDPPAVELSDATEGATASLAPGIWDRAGGVFVGTAHAQAKLIKRIRGAKVGRAIAEAVPGADEAKLLVKGLRETTKALRTTKAKVIRKYVQEKGMLKATYGLARTGKKNVKEFLKGDSNARMEPLVILAIVGYLAAEWESFTPTERTQLASMYGRFAAGVVIGFKDDKASRTVTNAAHGALFHLANIALAQAAHRANPSLFPAIKAIEGARVLSFAISDSNRVNLKRRVDVILEATGGKEEWWEVKSFKRRDPKLVVSKWRFPGGRSGPHREFFLDAGARRGGAVIEGAPSSVSRVSWWIQKFDRTQKGGEAGLTGPQFTEVENRLRSEPTGSEDSVRLDFLGIYNPRIDVSHVNMFTLFFEQAKDQVLGQFADELVEELIDIVGP